MCVKALLDNIDNNRGLLNNLLENEPDPFLRRQIFLSLSANGQDMREAAKLLVHDKCAANRLLCLSYNHVFNNAEYYDLLKSALMDKSPVIRGVAVDNILRYYNSSFDFRAAYLERLSDKTAVALCGLGETGQKSDTVIISKYLNDPNPSIVRAAMLSLMCLDCETYNDKITEKLADANPGVAKTSYSLLKKYNNIDFNRVSEMFRSSPHEHTKLRAASILFSAPKWQALIHILVAHESSFDRVKMLATNRLRLWLVRFNRSYAQLSASEKITIRNILNDTERNLNLPPEARRELLFLLR